MIQSQELRLGNLITGVDGKVYKVDLSTLEFIESGKKGIEPIPLTEDWLLKMGFKSKINSSLVKFWNLKSITIYHEYYKHTSVDNLEWFALSATEYERRIYSVHQLQNLYFALTGKELEIK